ncbi:hypothetical protein Tco_1369208 [Tanacetum coccineum]
MLPIHCPKDQVVIGETSLSFSLDVVHSRVQRIRGDVAFHRLSLSDAMVPLIEPLSAENLVSKASTFGVPATATTTAFSTTFIQTNSVPPISVTDYEVSGAEPPTRFPSPSKIVFEKEELETTPEHATLRTFQVRGRSFPLRSLSLYAPLPSASVTSYDPSHLGLSFSLSFAWLASLFRYTRSPGLKLVLRTLELYYFSIFALLHASRIAACSFLSSKRSRLISKASSFCTMFISAILKVGMPISAENTTFVPYVSKNNVSPFLDLIMVRCAHKTCEISLIQSLLLSFSRAFIPSPKLLFSLSTKLLAYGCLVEAKR